MPIASAPYMLNGRVCETSLAKGIHANGSLLALLTALLMIALLIGPGRSCRELVCAVRIWPVCLKAVDHRHACQQIVAYSARTAAMP